MSDEIRIRMSKTVKADLPFLVRDYRSTILEVGKEYKAMSNQYGAISGICNNGELLGVKPGEFEFIQAPQWIWDLHLNRKGK